MDVDEFSDDGFEGITDNALQELEDRAIQFTQAQKHPSHHPSHAARGHGWEDDDDLDTTEVTNDAGVAVGRPVVDKTLRPQFPTQQPQPQPPPPPQLQLQLQQHRPRPRPPLPNPQWNPSTVNLNLNLNLPAPPSSSLVARTRLHLADPPADSQLASQFHPTHPTHPTQSARPQDQSSSILSALQRRVRALEVELQTARGEASILRSNLARSLQEHDAQISHLKQQNAEQVAQHDQAVKTALAAEQSASTELHFLQRDMREVRDRDRARRKEAPASSTTTPRKAAKTWGMADGFDDMDLAASPRRNGGGSVALNIGERTPTRGKRKRPLVDSPVAALETHVGDVDMMGQAEVEEVASRSGTTLYRPAVAAPAAPFDFLQLLLGHGFARGEPPTFDVLSRFSFPSDPAGMSISTMIFERLPLLGSSHLPMQLLADFALQIISLWTRCYEEQFWPPVKYLVSLIAFTFQLNASSVAPLVFRELIPIAQSTIFLVAEGPQRLPDGTITNADEYNHLEQHIDTAHVFSLLHTTAQICATTPTETDEGPRYTAATFWRLFSPEMVRLLLAPKQRPSDIVATLDLLATSSLPASIGPIVDGREPAATASDVIDRVSAKLTEHARAPNTPAQKRRIRAAALRTLIAFARHPFGAQQLASHRDALPRLVTCLGTSIDHLYDQPLPASILAPLPPLCIKSSALSRMPESTASTALCRIISQCVLLIHALATDPLTAPLTEIPAKLAVYHGASQRYLIALGRLAFAEEDLVIEAGIEGHVVEAAHELLEMAVTPEEGETVSEAFGA